MKWVIIVLRSLVGALFAFSAVTLLFNLIEPPPQEGNVELFGKLLISTGYMTVVKILELIGGVLLLSGRLAPLGITILMPIAVNILLFEVFMARMPGIGLVLVLVLGFLIWGYRSSFRSVFTTNARIG